MLYFSVHAGLTANILLGTNDPGAGPADHLYRHPSHGWGARFIAARRLGYMCAERGARGPARFVVSLENPSFPAAEPSLPAFRITVHGLSRAARNRQWQEDQ